MSTAPTPTLVFVPWPKWKTIAQQERVAHSAPNTSGPAVPTASNHQQPPKNPLPKNQKPKNQKQPKAQKLKAQSLLPTLLKSMAKLNARSKSKWPPKPNNGLSKPSSVASKAKDILSGPALTTTT